MVLMRVDLNLNKSGGPFLPRADWRSQRKRTRNERPLAFDNFSARLKTNTVPATLSLNPAWKSLCWQLLKQNFSASYLRWCEARHAKGRVDQRNFSFQQHLHVMSCAPVEWADSWFSHFHTHMNLLRQNTIHVFLTNISIFFMWNAYISINI